jgi:hypothetical protein
MLISRCRKLWFNHSEPLGIHTCLFTLYVQVSIPSHLDICICAPVGGLPIYCSIFMCSNLYLVNQSALYGLVPQRITPVLFWFIK